MCIYKNFQKITVYLLYIFKLQNFCSKKINVKKIGYNFDMFSLLSQELLFNKLCVIDINGLNSLLDVRIFCEKNNKIDILILIKKNKRML